MSSTDQAFIRAYGQPTRSRSAATVSQRSPLASAAAVDGLLAQPALAWSEGPLTASSISGQMWTLHSASIDVGLDSPIPAPHFALRAAPRAVSVAFSSEADEVSRVATPRVSFGKLPKAPLSSFTGDDSEIQAHSATRPMYEIDAVHWPSICHKLLAECGSQFSQLADDLRQEAAEGRKVLAITGLGRDEGRTTLALCLAKQLAESRIRVAIVDADFASPSLAGRLGINSESGWETALTGEQTIWEVMIEATTESLSIVPLAAAHFADEMPRPVYGIAAVLAELAERFDVVLVDAGPLAAEEAADWLLDPASGVQGVILAHNARRSEASQLAAACLQLAEAGVRQLGIAEMFVNKE